MSYVSDFCTVCVYFSNNFNLVWSEDGQLLAVSSPNGTVGVYLMKLPLVASVSSHRIAYMTSLKEITIYDHLSKQRVNC